MIEREIISQRQANILSALQTMIDAPHDLLQEIVGLPNGDYKRQISDLRARGLVVACVPGGPQRLRLHISRAGAQALADHIDHHSYIKASLCRTEPARINRMTLPAYKPAPTYYRNDGHVTLPSRGAC